MGGEKASGRTGRGRKARATKAAKVPKAAKPGAGKAGRLGLGKAQKRILRGIESFWRKNGAMPLMKRIMGFGGFKGEDGYSRVFNVLDSLKGRGLVAWEKGDLTTLRLTDRLMVKAKKGAFLGFPGPAGASSGASPTTTGSTDPSVKAKIQDFKVGTESQFADVSPRAFKLDLTMPSEVAFSILTLRAEEFERRAAEIREHVASLREAIGRDEPAKWTEVTGNGSGGISEPAAKP